jgi:hypothetical protein
MGGSQREDPSQSVNLKVPLQNKVKLNTLKDSVKSPHGKHNIFITGDSHVRGLSDKV